MDRDTAAEAWVTVSLMSLGDSAHPAKKMPRVAASTGSACHAGTVELSPVLRAMGVKPEVGMGAIRFSLGRGTTREEIEEVVARALACGF